MSANIKKRRHVLSLQDKQKLIEEVDRNPVETQVNIAKRLKIPVTTLNSIYSNKEKLITRISEISCSSKGASSRRKNLRGAKYGDMEEILLRWFKEQRAANMPIDGLIMHEKALEISLKLGISNFSSSIGWMTRFKNRYNLSYKCISGESGSVDSNVTDHWIENTLPTLIKDYQPRDIYNVDETGLFYDVLPDKTLNFKGDKCHGGKHSKRRLTVACCTNADGLDKRKPLFIGKFKKPRCFKNIRTLSTKYTANTKAWMTSVVFKHYLLSLDATMGAQNRKIILFLDQCSAHTKDVSLRNTKIAFFPANCASKLQPLDLGIINCLKVNYRKSLVRKMIGMVERKVKVSKIKINILQAMHDVMSSWNKIIGPSTIQKCFAKAGFIFSTAETDEEMDFEVQTEEEEAEGFNEDLDWQALDIGCNFADYVAIDNDIVTSQLATVDELCDAATSKSDDEEIEDTEEGVHDDPDQLPNFHQAMDAMEQVRRFLYPLGIEDDVLDNCYKIESVIGRARFANLKQKSIDDYFSVIPGGSKN